MACILGKNLKKYFFLFLLSDADCILFVIPAV